MHNIIYFLKYIHYLCVEGNACNEKNILQKQGLPGPPGEKGETGDVGQLVRFTLMFLVIIGYNFLTLRPKATPKI